MKSYFLGGDLGGTKTRVLITDETGVMVGFGDSGPGNHEAVGYDGFTNSLRSAMESALFQAKISMDQIDGAGFGVAGYDWPVEREPTLKAIERTGLACRFEAVNDASLGVFAGPRGWGVAVVSGTGCNARGWDETHRREGKVTGGGLYMGEAAGASELIICAIQAVAQSWTLRGPKTALVDAFLQFTDSDTLEQMLARMNVENLSIDSEAARLIFQVAGAGDPVALKLIHWAGCELGELANAVIRQLDFQNLDFDVILTGSMFDGGPLLTDPMKQTVLAFAPHAHFIRLTVPPVTGALILGMEVAGVKSTSEFRRTLEESLRRNPHIVY
jgi:N-acetylglucosamine kinase-like BadF-type ATPase